MPAMAFSLRDPENPLLDWFSSKVTPETTAQISRLSRPAAFRLLVTTDGKAGSFERRSRQLGGWFGAQQPA
jgi:hypothetical protein